MTDKMFTKVMIHQACTDALWKQKEPLRFSQSLHEPSSLSMWSPRELKRRVAFEWQVEGKEMKGKERKGKERKGKERKGKERKGKERKGKERKGKERKGKERKGKERKGKERKGKERKGKAILTTIFIIFYLHSIFFRILNFYSAIVH